MATYCIGDVQGCFDELSLLLHSIAFDAQKDRLIFLGDLVNRGPFSLAVLDFVMKTPCASMVLGNHDLHLLATAAGARNPSPKDTFDDILRHERRSEMLDWLRRQPLVMEEKGYFFVHAGLLPQWPIGQAKTLAKEIEEALQGSDYQDFLKGLYGNVPDQWRDTLQGMERLRVIVNGLTRLRICTQEGKMNLSFAGTIDAIPDGYYPWFAVPGRQSQDTPIIFGHWAALGFYQGHHVIGLDSGCVWGNALTAYDLDTARVYQIQAKQPYAQGD
jgi:bis(5'-nucleosyl)-tetraphosphatase (symmetrical)